MPKVSYTYCDSCVFLAYFNGEPGRVELLDQLFEEITANNSRKLVTSTFSIIEVAHLSREKQQGKIDPLVEAKLDEFWQNTSLLEMVDFYELLARQARGLMRTALKMGYSLKGADALHLVSAQAVGALELYTYDDKLLERYAEIIGVTVCQPYVNQPKLPL
jgi:predicted nucleic acid-binding protein